MRDEALAAAGLESELVGLLPAGLAPALLSEELRAVVLPLPPPTGVALGDTPFADEGRIAGLLATGVGLEDGPATDDTRTGGLLATGAATDEGRLPAVKAGQVPHCPLKNPQGCPRRQVQVPAGTTQVRMRVQFGSSTGAFDRSDVEGRGLCGIMHLADMLAMR